jgi:hypothetical protein
MIIGQSKKGRQGAKKKEKERLVFLSLRNIRKKQRGLNRKPKKKKERKECSAYLGWL